MAKLRTSRNREDLSKKGARKGGEVKRPRMTPEEKAAAEEEALNKKAIRAQKAQAKKGSNKKSPLVVNTQKKKSSWTPPPMPDRTDPMFSITEIDVTHLLLSVENPRTDLSTPSARRELDELGKSIVCNGVTQPIVITPIEFVEPEVIAASRERTHALFPMLKKTEATHGVVAGERRTMATLFNLIDCCENNRDKIPCRVEVYEDKFSRMKAMFTENTNRVKVNSADEAVRLYALYEMACKDDKGLTQSEFAKRIGVNITTVNQLFRLIEIRDDKKCPFGVELFKRVYDRKLSPQHAVSIYNLKDGRSIKAILRMIDSKKFNASEISKRISAIKESREHKAEDKTIGPARKAGRPIKPWDDRPPSCVCAMCSVTDCNHHPCNPRLAKK